MADARLRWILLLFTIQGLLLVLIPHALSMLPPSGRDVGAMITPRQNMIMSLTYVLPLALSYPAAAALIAMLDSGLRTALLDSWSNSLFLIILAELAAAIFWLLELQRRSIIGPDRQPRSLAGAAIAGILSSLLIVPCMTVLLAYIGDSNDIGESALTLLASALGISLPLWRPIMRLRAQTRLRRIGWNRPRTEGGRPAPPCGNACLWPEQTTAPSRRRDGSSSNRCPLAQTRIPSRPDDAPPNPDN
ncbi:hypothetical protein [Chromobacterium violaceum]|uniref:cytochrome c biogenesis protein CcdA n=1 Tax=Chromobacterium violaceum TaxID=536 RepID=UPI001B340103|nr:hypothetical protein [Chromobacterium violaceum]MBP4044152.1 hypothetical protein [Chromobacterium violaceum]